MFNARWWLFERALVKKCTSAKADNLKAKEMRDKIANFFLNFLLRCNDRWHERLKCSFSCLFLGEF